MYQSFDFKSNGGVNPSPPQRFGHQNSAQPTRPAGLYDLTAGPLVMKYDFKNKYPVKGITVTCDQRTAIFNV